MTAFNVNNLVHSIMAQATKVVLALAGVRLLVETEHQVLWICCFFYSIWAGTRLMWTVVTAEYPGEVLSSDWD